MSHEVARAYLAEWTRIFGFSHYRSEVNDLDDVTEGCWARILFEHEEEWFRLEIVADDRLPPETLELLVLHELAHGLVSLAGVGDHAEEVVCNRVARIATLHKHVGSPTVRSMNEHASATDPTFWTEAAVQRDKWVSVLVDGLPERERDVLTALYWDGVSIRELAGRLKVHPRTIGRWRDEGIRRLRRAYFNLERAMDGEDGSTTH